MFRLLSRLIIIALGIGLGACGCSSSGQIERETCAGTPVGEPPGARVVEIKKLVIRAPASESPGTFQSGWGCFESRPLFPAAGRAFLAEGELEQVFREEFSSNGYTVAGDPNALFEETSQTRPDFLIGGIVRDVKVGFCSSGLGFTAASRGRGETSLAVDWQVYSPRTRKVELSVTSNGALGEEGLRDLRGFGAFEQAFRVAVRNVLADPQLRELLAGPAATRQRAPEDRPIVVAFETVPRLKKVSPEAMLSQARLSVVTIVAGDAFGSGFLISPDGYLLTSQHVIAGARYVTARFVTGREVSGEVVRVNVARDVALVKLEKDRYRPLPLGNTSGLRPGTDVFAIGTPLSEEFGQTVTRGIVSGFGEDDGQRLIHSDVGIHKGNSGGPLLIKSGEVVGIAVGGVILMPMGIGVGLNSFIPIEEAIEKLGLRNRPGAHRADLKVVSRETPITK